MSRLKNNLKLITFIIISVFIVFNEYGFAQNLNPPYPRIGQVYFYGIGAGDEIWKNHDLLSIRHDQSSSAGKVKAKNPDIIILGASAVAAGEEIERLIGESFPEEWFVRFAGESGKIRLWGGYLMNLTDSCPEVDFIYGRQKFYEFLAEFFDRHTNWQNFDGLYFDGWVSDIQWYWYNYGDMDFDNDGVADGQSNAGSRWRQGNELLVNETRRVTGKLILAHEAPTSYFFNGNGFEFWSQVSNPPQGHSANMYRALGMLESAVEPRFNYANSEASDNGPLFRADFASAQIVGAFFGHDEGSFAHRYTLLHDEYEANLGYPTSSPRVMESGVWIRYFDNGVVLANISGEARTVTASELSGGPYYRFLGNQAPDVNNGYIVDGTYPIQLNGTVQKRDSDEMCVIDGIMLFKQPTTLVTPIIIDNQRYNMTTPGQSAADYNGSWTQTMRGGSAYSLRCTWDQPYGNFYAYSMPGGGENVASYEPKINVPGEYEVFEWHGYLEPGLNAASNVPYRIVHKDGAAQGTIDQTREIGKWNSLGSFHFNTGRGGYVQLTNNANGVVISDAIRFKLKNAANYNPPPPDIIPPNGPRNLGLESNTETSIAITWSPPLAASDGDVATYYLVYRDGQNLGTVYTTRYEDTGLTYKTSYEYTVYSVDDAGNQTDFPATRTLSTLGDEDPPEITSVNAISLNTIKVEFNEAVGEESAENINNYSISNGITITKAELYSDLSTVYLKTSTQTPGDSYSITVNNIVDRAPELNTIAANTQKTFIAQDNLFVSISADDRYELYVNGNRLGEGNIWWTAEPFIDLLGSEINVIAVKATNAQGEAGLLVEIEKSGKTFVSNESWKVSKIYNEGWEGTDFPDDSWGKATSYGEHGTPEAVPWGNTLGGGVVEGISTDKGVKWIWTDDNVGDNEVYFRYVFTLNDMTPPNPPQGVKVTIP